MADFFTFLNFQKRSLEIKILNLPILGKSTKGKRLWVRHIRGGPGGDGLSQFRQSRLCQQANWSQGQSNAYKFKK